MTLFDKLVRTIRPGLPKFGVLGFVVGLFFGVAGAFLCWSTSLSPLIQYQSSGSWLEVEARVLESKLELKSDSDGDSASIAIRYEYFVDGYRYESDRYSFSNTSRNFAIQPMRDIVAKYHDGKEVKVFVDPEDPAQAVVVRDLNSEVVLGAVFSLPFLLVGGIALIGCCVGGRLRRQNKALRERAAVKAEQMGARLIAHKLRDTWSDNETIIFLDGEDRSSGLVLFGTSLFVNGIISVLFVVMIMMLLSGEGMGVFFLVLVIPGLWVGWRLIAQTCEHFGGGEAPDYVVYATPVYPLSSAMTVTLSWVYIGDSLKLSQLSGLRISVYRGDAFGKEKQLEKNLDPYIVASEDYAVGESHFSLERSEKVSKFKQYEGCIKMLLNWEILGRAERRKYTLGQTDND